MSQNVLKCVVVDDEPLARKVLIEYIDEDPGLELLKELKSAVELKHFVDTTNDPADIIFLDINMPKMSGIDYVKNFDLKSPVVFTTAHPEFAVEAFEYAAADYLLKPVSLERFMKCIDKIREQGEHQRKDWLVIRENRRMYKLMCSDIHYLQAYGDYVKIMLKDKNHITKARLSELADTLDSRFRQCHRSYVVNMDHIEYMEGNHLLVHGEKIPVSKAYRDVFLGEFS